MGLARSNGTEVGLIAAHASGGGERFPIPDSPSLVRYLPLILLLSALPSLARSPPPFACRPTPLASVAPTPRTRARLASPGDPSPPPSRVAAQEDTTEFRQWRTAFAFGVTAESLWFKGD